MEILQGKLNTIKSDKNVNLLPEHLKSGVNCLGVTGTVVELVPQTKKLEVITDGTYNILPDDGYNGLSSVTVDVLVASSMETQHMPFYLLESDNEGNLWCINNYSSMEYVPYSLDIDGNLIVTQDDTDTARYWINENMELEVEVDG